MIAAAAVVGAGGATEAMAALESLEHAHDEHVNTHTSTLVFDFSFLSPFQVKTSSHAYTTYTQLSK